jgi:hypothetical protein
MSLFSLLLIRVFLVLSSFFFSEFLLSFTPLDDIKDRLGSTSANMPTNALNH